MCSIRFKSPLEFDLFVELNAVRSKLIFEFLFSRVIGFVQIKILNIIKTRLY